MHFLMEQIGLQSNLAPASLLQLLLKTTVDVGNRLMKDEKLAHDVFGPPEL